MLLLPLLALAHVGQASPAPKGTVATVISVRKVEAASESLERWKYKGSVMLPAPRGARLNSPRRASRYTFSSSSTDKRRRGIYDIHEMRRGVVPREVPLWDGRITVGTPPQALSCEFDIHSSELIIPISNTTTAGAFDSSSSTSFRRETSANTGDDAWGYDTVTIGGVTLEDQFFLTPPSSKVDRCVIGLNIGHCTQAGFLDDVLASGHLKSDSVSYSYANDEFCLGCVDSAKYTGDIEYHPMRESETGAWSIPGHGISVNGYQVAPGTHVTIDGGAQTIELPYSIAGALYRALSGFTAVRQADGTIHYERPCEEFDHLASIDFVIGDKTYGIHGKDIKVQLGPEAGQCKSAIVGVDEPIITVGIPFLKKLYAVVDRQNGRLGLARGCS